MCYGGVVSLGKDLPVCWGEISLGKDKEETDLHSGKVKVERSV